MKKHTNLKLLLVAILVWSGVAYAVNSTRPASTSVATVAALEMLR